MVDLTVTASYTVGGQPARPPKCLWSKCYHHTIPSYPYRYLDVFLG
jgi:hypothetical protein